MNQNNFMMDYFRVSDKVSVNARELQKVLQDKYRYENELKTIKAKLAIANSLLAARNEEINVQLDITV